MELLPSPPAVPLRMDDDVKDEKEEDLNGALNIRGAAKVEPPVSAARKLLLEKLAKAKAESNSSSSILTERPVNAQSIDPANQSEPLLSSLSSPSVRAVVRARLKLRLKLASEKKQYTESRAQVLRIQILEARARREIQETDAVLKRLDRDDRAREIRRRLMVEKMMSAETDSERRARELKERLLGERKARLLKEKLREKRKGQEGFVETVEV
jgi:E3 ubiquitin-protein ligase Topors